MARRSLKMSAASHGVGAGRRRSLARANLTGRGVFTCVPRGPEEAEAAGEGEVTSGSCSAPPRSPVVPLLRHELQQQLLELERGATSHAHHSPFALTFTLTLALPLPTPALNLHPHPDQVRPRLAPPASIRTSDARRTAGRRRRRRRRPRRRRG